MGLAHVVMFSGGKDSTAMLLRMLELGRRIDEILFVDTTKEFPEMYDHILSVERFIGRPITRREIQFDYFFSEHEKTKGKNKGERGYGWPKSNGRWCTALKRAASAKFLSSLKGIPVEYHGIALDEKHRCERNTGRSIRYPLVRWGWTEKDALQYCYNKGFHWTGLYEKFHRVSCFCCPLKRLEELRVLREEFPALWKEILEMDRRQKYDFKEGWSLPELDIRFRVEVGQNG